MLSVPCRLFFAVAIVAATLAPSSSAQLDQLPRRQPERGVKHAITVTVPFTTLGLRDGRRESFDGNLGYHKPEADDDPKTKEPELDFEAFSDIVIADAQGAMRETEAGFRFRLDPDNDPIGGAEDLSGRIGDDLRYRLLASSDFALIPLRMLFRHEMPSGSGSRAIKKSAGDGYRVVWSERFAGLQRISITNTRRYESKTVRTFIPSGFQLIDYILSFEDQRDDTILASFAIRMLTHPTRTDADGVRPPGGVFHIAMIENHQLDWLKEKLIFPRSEFTNHVNQWLGRLTHDLFDDIEREAIGLPDELPYSVAMRAFRILDATSHDRLMTTAKPWGMAAIAPMVVSLGVPFDPKPYRDAFDAATDPRRRLRLATACAAAGETSPDFLTAARVGFQSTSPDVRRDAYRLAGVLRDSSLTSPLGASLSSSQAEETLIEGLLALGAIGGPAGVTEIGKIAGSPLNDRVKGAAFRALADTGEVGVDELLEDSNARVGAISTQTGRFELLIDDADQATTALLSIYEFARAARRGDADAVLEWVAKVRRDPKTNQADKIALSDTCDEWLPRLGALVPRLSDRLEEGNYRKEARRIVALAGRSVVEDILKDLRAAKTLDDKTFLCKLVGCTRDPRARAALVAMQESDDLNDFQAASDGLNLMEEKLQ